MLDLILSEIKSKNEVLNEVYTMLVNSYSKVSGGFVYHPLDLLSKEGTEWHLCLQSGKIKCVIIYKDTEFGRKVILCGCDNTNEGKIHLVKTLSKNLSNGNKRYYCEASESIEAWLIKKKVKAHPNEFASKILKNEEIELDDDGIHYYRNINGVIKRKAIYGNFITTI